MTEKQKRGPLQIIMGLFMRTAEDHVPAYAAQTAYFLIMSFIPFIMLLLTLVKYTPLTYNMVHDAISNAMPSNIQGFVMNLVAEVYGKSSAVLPLTGLVALWSSCKGMQAMMNGLNIIYHVKETRNWFINRFFSMLYMLIFAAAIIISLLMLVLGESIKDFFLARGYFVGQILERVLGAKEVISFFVLLIVFLLLYKGLPNRKCTLKSQLPGAIFTTVSWILFSFGFSLYFELFPGSFNMYGSLSTIISIMLWLYICMNLTFWGALINSYFEKDFYNALQLLRKKYREEKAHIKGIKNKEKSDKRSI